LDAVTLSWNEVHFDRKNIERVTRKRKKRVVIPIHTELLFALEAEHDDRKPKPSDRVLLNPETIEPMSRPRLYQRMLALGTRAGVPHAHPHRFRDTLAVDMLLRGATPYDVAKTLGDTIETVEKHYAPFVKELQDRVRRLLEAEGGLEQAKTEPRVTPASQSTTRTQ
jgi:integrase